MKRRFGPGMETLLALALGLIAIYVSLLPYSLAAERVPSPDLVFCLVAVWVIRRPTEAPLWAVLVLGLLGDALLSRPIGLGALGLLLASEVLRANAAWLRSGPILLEWLMVTLVFAGMTLAVHLAMQLVFLDGARPAILAGHVLTTAMGYPLAVMAIALGFGLRAPRRGREDRLGRIP